MAVVTLKNDFYEKGADTVVVSVYVKDIDVHEVNFDAESVSISFSTSNQTFLKSSNLEAYEPPFVYRLETRNKIIPSESKWTVKRTLIELSLKKASPIKWSCLEKLTVRAKVTSETSIERVKQASSDLLSCSKDANALSPTSSPSKRVSFDTDATQSTLSRSPRKSPQLLGGKSTPVIKKGSSEDVKKRSDVDVSSSNQNSSTAAADQRNIQKNVTVHSEPVGGLTGLENYANNCYMNVVIQVLANIQELRDYFKHDVYLNDIVSANPLSSSGKVVKAFADVVKALWISEKRAFKPLALKNIMGRQCSIFLGWQQHDAQEFCASLLDNLHEDLNHGQIPEKSSVEKDTREDVDGPTINEKPDTAWSAHIKRNSSVIVKLFHGQLVSKVTCGACHKTSYSYDPCSQISIPIPSSKRLVDVLLFTRDVGHLPVRISLQVSTQNAQVWHLIHMLQSHIGIPAHLMVVFKGTSEICSEDKMPLSAVLGGKYVVVSEIASFDEVDYFSVPVFQYVSQAGEFFACDHCKRTQRELAAKLKRCTRCMCAAYCSRDCQSKHWQLHIKVCAKGAKLQVGLPYFVTLLRRDTTFADLENAIRTNARTTVEVPVHAQKSDVSMETSACAEGGVSDTMPTETKLIGENMPSDEGRDLQHCPLVLKLSNQGNKNSEDATVLTADNFAVEKILKATCLIAEWQTGSEEGSGSKALSVCTREAPLFERVGEDSAPSYNNQEEKCSLQDCLKLFMEPELLDESESWRCPKCRSLQSAKKEMAISFPPAILMLHMKRFTFGEFGQKISKAVSYPLSDFDVSPYVARETRHKIDHPMLYDLCGVICHRGTMRMGHYTCMVRLINQRDEEEVGWRYFDDDEVTKIKEDKVVSPEAYVLVYRLRGSQSVLRPDRPFHPILCPVHGSLSPGPTPYAKRKLATSASDRAVPSQENQSSLISLKRSYSSDSPGKHVEGAGQIERDEQDDPLELGLRHNSSPSSPTIASQAGRNESVEACLDEQSSCSSMSYPSDASLTGSSEDLHLCDDTLQLPGAMARCNNHQLDSFSTSNDASSAFLMAGEISFDQSVDQAQHSSFPESNDMFLFPSAAHGNLLPSFMSMEESTVSASSVECMYADDSFEESTDATLSNTPSDVIIPTSSLDDLVHSIAGVNAEQPSFVYGITCGRSVEDVDECDLD